MKKELNLQELEELLNVECPKYEDDCTTCPYAEECKKYADLTT